MQGAAFIGNGAEQTRRYAFGMRNRMDDRYDFVRTVADGRYRYIRNYMPNRPWGQHLAFAWLAKGYQDWERQYRAGRLNTDQARFFQEKPFEEFYDLQTDRDEVRNLIDDPAQQERIDVMRRAVTQHMLDINDNGFIPEGSPLEGYIASRAPGAYPLEAIMALAETAARRDPRQLDLLCRRLDDPNEVVRFWAAQGLLMLRGAAAPAASQLRAMMQTDRSPAVQIVAAEAVARLGDPGEAIAALAGFVEPRHPSAVRLQALNALTFLGELARPAMPAIARAAASDEEYLRSAGRYLKAVLDGSYDPAKRTLNLPPFLRVASGEL
jgi:hypothetical protein